jgi:cytochrome c-type biogenesis protein CcmE
LFLVLYALQQNIDFFYTPTQIAQGEAPVGHLIRAGGLVQPGSVYHIGQSLLVTFKLTDKKKIYLLVITGYYPHYFVKGRGLL